ncbi:hypothetical protein VaNZ11_005804 [Volvox africanus]|uniref:dolichol kinase n=1 Tax=Volvox africanus TaxID=51714 RepID=A0ABQ5RZD4_9CHLO|nr:hypothetical protein VaNZ11_005804 [Volvox africanus]
MWSPQNVEAGLQAASIFRLGFSLLGPALHGQRGPGAALHALCMTILAALALFLDRRGPSWFQDHPLYMFRACGQAGLAQGLLALPSLATAIFVATRSWWWQQAARLFLASSFQVLFWFAWTTSLFSSDGRSNNISSSNPDGKATAKAAAAKAVSANATAAAPCPAFGGRQGRISPTAAEDSDSNCTRIPSKVRQPESQLPLGINCNASRLLFLTASAVGCPLSAANALLHAVKPPEPSSPQLLLPGSVFELPRDITTSAWVLQGALLLATVPSLDHMASVLPRSFTPGEMSILIQVLLALAAGSCTYLMGASRQGLLHVLWSPHVVQLVGPDPGMHVPAFCMLVLFWVLVLAGCSAMSLQGLGPGGSQASQGEGAKGKESMETLVAESPLQATASASGTPVMATALTRRRRRQLAGASSSRAKRPVALANVTPTPASIELQHPGSDIRNDATDWLITSGIRAAAAFGAVLSFAMLIDLALWVLGRFVAASSQPRLATLAYWFGCLAVTVPFMYVVSRASATRNQQRHQMARLERLEKQQQPWEEEDGGGNRGKEEEAGSGRAPMVTPMPDGAAARHLTSSTSAEPREDLEPHVSATSGYYMQRRNGHVGEEASAVARSSGVRNPCLGDMGDGSRNGGRCGVAPVTSFPPAADECPGNGPGPVESLAAYSARSISSYCMDRGTSKNEVKNSRTSPDSLAVAQRQLPQLPRPVLLDRLFRALAVPHIVMRKGYHLLAIVLFLPAFGWDVRMLQASLAVAGAVLVFVELLRVLGPRQLRHAIGGFMKDFADARDSGPVYVTHFTLLLGIAVPVWLGDSVCGAAAGAMMGGLYGSKAAEPMSSPSAPDDDGPLAPRLSVEAARLLPSCRTVLGLSGLVSLGSGDTAAACVGFLLGQWRLFAHGKKTWEGTLSGAAAMLGSWAVVVWWMDVRWAMSWDMWVALAAVTGCVAMLEAVTQQLDNVVVPLYYFTHLVLTMTGH